MLARDLCLASAIALVGFGRFADPGVQVVVDHRRAFAAVHGAEAASTARSTRAGEGGRGGRGPDGPTRRASMMADDSCIESEPLVWFGAIRPLDACGFDRGLPSQPGDAADVNGDGKCEYFGLPELDSPSSPIASGGTPLPNRDLFRLEYAFRDGRSRMVRSSIFGTQALAEWIIADRGRTSSIYCFFGWADLDGDRDLDLIATFESVVGGQFLYRDAWLENVGYEASEPVAGDLTGDGIVDAADLATLLGSWTGD